MTRSDGTAGLAAERWPVRGMLDHTYQRTASIKYIVVTTKHLVRHFTDAHTWPRLEVKAMAAWELVSNNLHAYSPRFTFQHLFADSLI